MVYELTLKSVQLKTTIFNPPAKLINYKELSCAIGMAYKQAGLPYPVVENGSDMKLFRENCINALINYDINEKIKHVIENYVSKPDEQMDKDSQITMKLGYEAEA